MAEVAVPVAPFPFWLGRKPEYDEHCATSQRRIQTRQGQYRRVSGASGKRMEGFPGLVEGSN